MRGIWILDNSSTLVQLDLFKPIPILEKKKNYQLNINECGEKLIALEDIKELVKYVYFRFKDNDNYEKTYVRTGVAKKLINAVKLIPDNLKLGINEGYRTYEKQKYYFDKYVKVLNEKFPNKTIEELQNFCFYSI